jgi:hypothetical protein
MSTAPHHVMTITIRGEYNQKLPDLPPNPSADSLIRQMPVTISMQGGCLCQAESESPYEAFAFLRSRTMEEDFCRQAPSTNILHWAAHPCTLLFSTFAAEAESKRRGGVERCVHHLSILLFGR